MDPKDVKKILDAVSEAEIRELVLETGDYKLTVKRGAEQVLVQAPPAAPSAPAPAPAPAAPAPAPAADPPAGATPDAGSANPAPAPAAEPASNLAAVTAPIVGTFYAAPSPDADPYVKVGDRVAPGTVLCIIEAMKLMNEIEAETAGVVKEILVKNEEPVEYGQVLFRIEPA